MSDVLSQSEIESLLAALDPATAAGPGRGGASDARRHSGGDSRRPARVGPELLRALWTLHEGFAQAFEASLRGLLTSTVEVRSAGIDELTYGEFVSGVDDPTCLAALNADPLGATFLCQFESAIVFPIVDRLLGGEGAPASAMPRRPLTDIELRLLWRVADLAAGALRGVWRDVCDLKPKVVQVEGQLHLITFVPPESPIVQLSFDMSLGDSAGTMNVCLPVSALEPLAGRLLGTAGANRVSDQRETAGNGVDSAHADAQVIVQLASTRLAPEEVANLAIGDVIVTECHHDQPLIVRVDGTPRFTGSAGLVDGRKAVRIGAALPADAHARKSHPAAEEAESAAPD